MKFLTILVVTLFALIYGITNYYIGLKGYKSINFILPFLNLKVYWIMFWLIALSFIVSKIIGNYIPRKVNHLLSIIGDYWMASLFFFIIIVAFSGILKLITKFMWSSLNHIMFQSKFTTLGGITLIIFVLFLLVYGTINAEHSIVKSYSININKYCGNIKKLNVVFISDIHIGEVINRSRIIPMIKTINNLKPDIVLLGGDTIDDSPNVFINEDIGNLFKNIKSKFGTYAVLGNHEYYSGKTEIIQNILSNGGINVLRDKVVKPENLFYIIGREDVESKRYKINRKSLPELMEGIDKNLPIIVMDHQPPRKKELLDSSVDLQVSGHTHKGQFFPNNLFTEKIYELDWGLLKRGANYLIVSLGYGTWGPPIRIGNTPEIVKITINFKSK